MTNEGYVPGDRLLTSGEWMGRVPESALKISPSVAIKATKLDALGDALTWPAATINGEPLFPDLASKVTAMMVRLARAKVARVGNPEVAAETGHFYLERNDHMLEGIDDTWLCEEVDQVARGERSETELASKIGPHIKASDSKSEPEPPDTLLLYIAVPEQTGELEYRTRLHDVAEAAAVQSAASLEDTVDLATTSPALIKREPEDDWRARRGVLVRGDVETLGPERAHSAAGMIVVAPEGADVEVGMEIDMLGPRAPILWLCREERSVPRLVQGYGSVYGNLRVRTFGSAVELGQHVQVFVREKASRMLALARQRRDAALAGSVFQHKLRSRYMEASPPALSCLLDRTNFNPSHLADIVAEPGEYSRTDFTDLTALANNFGESIEDHHSRPAALGLNRRQEESWFRTVIKLHLGPEESFGLRDAGVAQVVGDSGRVSMTKVREWENLHFAKAA